MDEKAGCALPPLLTVFTLPYKSLYRLLSTRYCHQGVMARLNSFTFLVFVLFSAFMLVSSTPLPEVAKETHDLERRVTRTGRVRAAVRISYHVHSPFGF